jgi:2,4-dienoyl-CoA reductase-like NADH-dependent reductase (Old Yellow Enzyme family)
MKQQFWSVSLATIIAAGALSLGIPTAARAESSKEKMYRVGTYAGAAATAYGVLRNKDTIAVAGAAGTYLAHRGWKNEINDRHDRWGNGRWDRDRRDNRDRYDGRDRYDSRDRYDRRDRSDDRRDDYRRRR